MRSKPIQFVWSKVAFMILFVCCTDSFAQSRSAKERIPQNEFSKKLAVLFEEDQHDRSGTINPEFIGRRDIRRRASVLKFLKKKQVKWSATDLYHMAMILQHSVQGVNPYTPNHYLMAHVLSVKASLAGHERARWLSAAALDRFLESIDRKQFFATQGTGIEKSKFRRGTADTTLNAKMYLTFRLSGNLFKSDELKQCAKPEDESLIQALTRMNDRSVNKKIVQKVYEFGSRNDFRSKNSFRLASQLLRKHSTKPRDRLVAYVYLLTSKLIGKQSPYDQSLGRMLDDYLNKIGRKTSTRDFSLPSVSRKESPSPDGERRRRRREATRKTENKV